MDENKQLLYMTGRQYICSVQTHSGLEGQECRDVGCAHVLSERRSNITEAQVASDTGLMRQLVHLACSRLFARQSCFLK